MSTQVHLEDHPWGCECNSCQVAFYDDFRTCCQCGHRRYWEYVPACLNEACEFEGYACTVCPEDAP